MVDGNPAKIVSALDSIDDSLAVTILLDLLDGYRVEVYVSLMSVEAVLVFDECVRISVWDAEDILSVVARNDLVPVLRVEVLKVLKRSTSQFAYLLEVKHLVDMHCVDMSWSFNGNRADAMLLVIVHGIESAYECRNVSSGFAWKVWPDIPECSAAAAASDGLVHVSCAAVICCDGKVPVSEDIVCILEILRCCVS